MKRKMGIVVKLIGMSVLPVFVLGIILSVYGERALQSNLKKEINNGLKSIAIAIDGSYDAAGEGDFTMLESGNVIKGMTVVSGSYDLYDKIRENSQTDTALYYREQLVVTSFTDEKGEHLTELPLTEEVKTQVLKNGKSYFSENLHINGKDYFGYYMPVQNEDGSIGGMIFAGKDAVSVKKQMQEQGLKMVGISIVLIVLAAVFTGAMAIAIAKALKQTMKMLGKVAQGDLRTEGNGMHAAAARRADEIGRMIKEIGQLRESLQTMIGNIHATSTQLSASALGMEESARTTEHTSQDMGTAVREISKGASAQAEDTSHAMANIEQMGKLIEQMVTEIGTLAEQSESIADASQGVNGIIRELSVYTAKTTDVIGEISRQTEVTNASAHEIQSAVEIIQSIAEETNLLSLNASIEAARAGENGKGFAVVAAQIQKLAEQSNQSAQQIEQVIETLLADAGKSVQTMREVVDMVGSQDEKLKQTEQGFIVVNTQIGKSKERIESIRQKSQVIDHSRKDIMEVVTNLSAISEENASVAEQTATSGENLNRVVEHMTKEAVTLKELSQQLEQQMESFVI